MVSRLLSISVLIISFSIVGTIQSIAQDQTRDVTSEQIRNMVETTSVPDKQAVDTKGSPFFNSDFVNGSITFKNNKTTNVIPLRYNSHEGTLQFKDKESIFAIEGSTIKEFELYASDGIIKFKKGFDARRLDKDEFVAVLSDGDAKFLVNYSKSYQEDLSGYGQATQMEEYRDVEDYYVKFGDDNTKRLRKLDERRVMGSFPSHKDELEQFAVQNNLRFDNITDVSQLFKYYNTLLEEGEEIDS